MLKLLSIFTLIMLACTILCGLWMKFGPGEKDARFHMILSLASVILSIVTITIYLFTTK